MVSLLMLECNSPSSKWVSIYRLIFNEINIVMSLSCTRASSPATRPPRSLYLESSSSIFLPLSLLLIFPPFPPSSCAFLPRNADGYLTSLPPPFKRESLLRLLLISSGLAIPLSHNFELLLLESVYNSRDNRMGWVHPVRSSTLVSVAAVRYVAIANRHLNLM